MMHVSDVTMFYSARSGGIRRYLLEKRRWLQARPGYRHSLVLPRLAATPGECTLEVPSLPLPFSRGYRIPLARQATVRALVALHPHVIEAGDPYQLAWAALDAGQLLGVPVVGFYHSDVPRLAERMVGPRAARFAEFYVRRLYERFDLVLAPSDCTVLRLRELGIAHVARQPLGVDTRVFTPAAGDARSRAALVAAFGAAPGDRLLVFVGRFAAEKNLPALWAMMDRLGPGHRLVLVGNGSVPSSRADVHVLPFVSDPARLARLVASCDLFVHAGEQETFGLAPLEAMACGLPVVAPRAAGLAELVDDSVGRAVDADDPATLPERLAEAVRALCALDLRPLKAAARERAERYDWERIVPEIVGRYAAIAGRGHPSAAAS